MSIESIGVRSVEITPGMIIIYKLRRDQKPRQPEKEWRGKVIYYNEHLHRTVVKSLEEGYEECQDDVWLEQIIRIEDHDNILGRTTSSGGECIK